MKVVALCGGVGGAKLAQGLASVLPPEELTLVVNTGDDFRHWGLQICPDLDTITYTLAGLVHPDQGWGRAGETFQALDAMRQLGGDAWFRLGDRDLATHLLRTQRLAAGERLTDVTRALTTALGVGHPVLPMADAPSPTRLDTAEGRLDFQEWFVRRRAAPRVHGIHFAEGPPPAPEVLAALDEADLVVIAPSNPYVSIEPILRLRGVNERVRACRCVAVSPIVAGAAVKGPLAEMLASIDGLPASAESALGRYGDLVDVALVHPGDTWRHTGAPRVVETDILLPGPAERARVARAVLAAGGPA